MLVVLLTRRTGKRARSRRRASTAPESGGPRTPSVSVPSTSRQMTRGVMGPWPAWRAGGLLRRSERNVDPDPEQHARVVRPGLAAVVVEHRDAVVLQVRGLGHAGAERALELDDPRNAVIRERHGLAAV